MERTRTNDAPCHLGHTPVFLFFVIALHVLHNWFGEADGGKSLLVALPPVLPSSRIRHDDSEVRTEVIAFTCQSVSLLDQRRDLGI
eukprot:6094099-Alexandrium_andersonii.AAC.1